MMAMTEVENVDVEEWNKELDDNILSKSHPAFMAVETLGLIV